MSNLTDALIAAKLVGGSGGSGGGSGLPEITTEPVVMLAEQSVNFTGQGGAYGGQVSGQYPINVGDNLTVTWDGVSYDCVASDVGGLPALGNLSILGMGADTGEPFVMAFYPEGGIEMYTRSGEVHTVGIFSSSQTPADGSIMQVVNGAWQPVVPSSGGTEVLPFTVRLSMKSNQTISQSSSRTVTLKFLDNNFPDSWNTAAGLSCYIQKDNTIYELVMLKVEFNLSARNAVATILNPLTNDCTINSTAEMYGYAIKLT